MPRADKRAGRELNTKRRVSTSNHDDRSYGLLWCIDRVSVRAYRFRLYLQFDLRREARHTIAETVVATIEAGGCIDPADFALEVDRKSVV